MINLSVTNEISKVLEKDPPKPLNKGDVKISRKNQKIVMEVIGEKGLKVSEYVDDGKNRVNKPYQFIAGGSL